MEKKQTVRFDKNRVRLRTGETVRDNGTYIYRWSDKEGKRHTVYAPTLIELREKEEQIAYNEHDGIKTDTNSLTVNSMFELWRSLKRGIKDSTLQNYIYMYDTFVAPTFGKRRLTKVKKSDVRTFYNTLYDDRGLKTATIGGLHNVLHQVFQIAVDDDLIRKNPTEKVMREFKLALGDDSEKKKALTLSQRDIFLNYLFTTPKYRHWYPLFSIMVNTGMRIGEATGLRWTDVDMQAGVIHINHTLVYYDHGGKKGSYYSINTPKTKAGNRDIPMTAGVKQAFEMEKAYQAEAELVSESHIDGYSDFVFINRFGQVLSQSAVNKALQRIVRDCNLEILEKHKGDDAPELVPSISSHHLRHTFATTAVYAGVGVRTLQELLGHTDISTTMGIYVDCTAEMKADEIKAYEAFLAEKAAKKNMEVPA